MAREPSSELSSPPAATGFAYPEPSDPAKSSNKAVKSSGKGRKRTAEESTVAAKRSKRATRASKPSYAENEETEELEQLIEKTPKKRGKTQTSPASKSEKVDAEVEVKIEIDLDQPSEVTNKKPARGRKAKAAVSVKEEVKKEEQEGEGEGEGEEAVKKTTRKRKTKEEKEAEAMPLAARTIGSKLAIGAHVSSAGGVHNSVSNCVHIGGNAFALFLKSQRKWANPPLKPEQAVMFKAHCDEHKYDGSKQIVPHGSYLVNLAHTDADRTKQAYDAFLDDLTRCHSLGIKLYNFHPGNAASSTRSEALKHLANQLNTAHKNPATGTVITLLETMAAFSGNTIGGTFEELATIISHIDDKARVGVCLDTCHIFAAGYDIRSPAAFGATLDKFDKVIGLDYLKALHVNDSKAPLASGRDLHANIGTGFLGLRAFHNIVNEPRLHGLPMVLETPIDVPNPDVGDKKKPTIEDKGVWAREIKLLESLVGMDVESEEFAELERELWDRGEGERVRVQDQVERREMKKVEKEGKAAKGKGKGGRKKKEESSAAESSADEA